MQDRLDEARKIHTHKVISDTEIRLAIEGSQFNYPSLWKEVHEEIMRDSS